MRRYIIAPKAAEDLTEIRAYLKREAGLRVAQSTLNKIKDAFLFLSRNPGAGHVREDLTDEPVKFWPVFSYLIVYNPTARPIEIARVIHSSRAVSAILAQDRN
ncbi:MAG TPA: type II toxin-antitoxin system RelE/ParE family toxin [Chthonomonadaceae bacterium]|nr:type II toxin-antitoxin system RelE/ParE family toxin [Chthonomonadaceae bacterium]